jgi:glucosamine-6-phosphate deaminase
MKIQIKNTKEELGREAAGKGAELIRKAIRERGEANIIVPAGASQFEMLEALVHARVDWSKVTAFHLDEYIGLTEDHPASFRKYLKERFVSKVPLKDFHYVDGTDDPVIECARLGEIILKYPIDVAFIGIGENGHLAFNDPPADFDTNDPFIIVNLDEACRTQQFNEGWFPSMEEVPKTAISMSVRQILKSDSIICTVPDKRKAEAVKNAIEGSVTPECPASILRTHSKVHYYLDREASSLIRRI